MFINVYNTYAEQKLLTLVEQNKKRYTDLTVLHFQLSKLPKGPTEEDLLMILRPLLQERSSAIYFFNNGDIIITWHGTQHAVIEGVAQTLYKHCSPKAERNLHKHYDLQANGEELRILLRALIRELPEHLHRDPADIHKLEFTKAQLQHMKKYAAERRTLKQPNVLIVEDQEFSRKLLEGLLSKQYTCYSALNAHDAVTLYAEHAPCITFLDIQLPDKNGHDLAAFIKKHDPESYIVMVTANHYDEDVEHARANHVQGFIVKPYSKQKILDSIHKYQNERKAS